MKEKKIMQVNKNVHSEAFCDLDYKKSVWIVNQNIVMRRKQK